MSFNDEVDGWISQLMGCKPLSEAEVKKLCDKVSLRSTTGWARWTWRSGAATVEQGYGADGFLVTYSAESSPLMRTILGVVGSRLQADNGHAARDFARPGAYVQGISGCQCLGICIGVPRAILSLSS